MARIKANRNPYEIVRDNLFSFIHPKPGDITLKMSGALQGPAMNNFVPLVLWHPIMLEAIVEAAENAVLLGIAGYVIAESESITPVPVNNLDDSGGIDYIRVASEDAFMVYLELDPMFTKSQVLAALEMFLANWQNQRNGGLITFEGAPILIPGKSEARRVVVADDGSLAYMDNGEALSEDDLKYIPEEGWMEVPSVTGDTNKAWNLSHLLKDMIPFEAGPVAGPGGPGVPLQAPRR